MWKVKVLTALVGAAALLVGFGSAANAAAPAKARGAAVVQAQAKSGTQADCSVHSDGRLYCGNRYGAILYWDPWYSAERTGKMLTTYSWFVCWQYGDYHAGGNNVWYWTQGDVAYSHSGWGFMAAVDVWTPVDPAPGLPQCPFN
jgi:hypothetical protein